jgi:hypothetical protein
MESIKKDLALLLVGIAAGAIPWLLDKVGIEMSKPVYIACLYLSFILIWWSLSSLGWLSLLPGIKDKSVSFLQVILAFIAGAIFCFMTIYFTHSNSNEVSFKDAKFETIMDRKFANETVPLDNREYIRCNFINVTFTYEGKSPIKFVNNKVDGFRFRVASPPVESFLMMLRAANFLAPGKELTEGPDEKTIRVD